MKWLQIGDLKIGDMEKKALLDVINSGRISEGVKVREFEKRFAEYIGVMHCVLVNSGTSALIAGIKAIEQIVDTVHEGDDIITTPLTYNATPNATINSGYNPLFVDVDIDKMVITPDGVKECLENNNADTSMILPVHLMGYTCDMVEMNKIAHNYGLRVLEDAAEAHGSMVSGKKAGSMGNASTFSFYVAHNIQAGEMGAVVTNNTAVAKAVKRIKANGRMCDCEICLRGKGMCPHRGEDYDPRFTHTSIGYNFKAMEFQAAIGVEQLKKANWIKERRLENVKYLNEQLDGVVKIPLFDKNVSYMAYPIVLDEGVNRSKVRHELEKLGVENRPLFSCIPTQQPAYKAFKKEYAGKLPNAEYLGNCGIYVGCHQYLTRDDLDYMVMCIKKVI